MKAARRNTLRLQQKLSAAKLKRNKSMKSMTKKQVKNKMMSPLQERAFHQLFSLEPQINELLNKIQTCPAKGTDIQELITDPRTIRILADISITEQMLAYMVKDSVGVVNKKQIASKNGVLPKRAVESGGDGSSSIYSSISSSNSSSSISRKRK